jgi:hypothetical protein
MDSTTVLVLGDEESRELVDAVLDLGLCVLVWQTIEGTLDRLRHRRFAGLVVDTEHADVDVLELVLNVRDVDPEVPIFVVSGTDGTEGDEIVRSIARTFVVEDPGRSQDFGDTLLKVVASGGRPPAEGVDAGGGDGGGVV